jgi:H+/Cl- antiporter ClcA
MEFWLSIFLGLVLAATGYLIFKRKILMKSDLFRGVIPKLDKIALIFVIIIFLATTYLALAA